MYSTFAMPKITFQHEYECQDISSSFIGVENRVIYSYSSATDVLPSVIIVCIAAIDSDLPLN